jgi:hypothetical protein
MKLTKLEIHRYRDIAPGTELMFSPAFNLVLGRNGTGRTTLLELISLVLGSDFSGLIHEEFSLEYDLALAGMEIHVVARNELRSRGGPEPVRLSREGAKLMPLRTPEVLSEFAPFIEATLKLEAPEARLVMRADASGLFCEVEGQKGYSRRMQWSVLDRTVWTLLFMAAQYIDREMKARLKELLRRTFLLAPSRFDEALGMFEHIGNIKYAMEMRDEEVFPLGLMALPTWMPGWLRQRVEQEPPTEAIEFRHDDLPRSFLSRFVAMAGFVAGKLRLEVLEKRTYENGGRLGFGQFSFHFTRPDGSVLTQAQLGHGQKRLLSFLYYLDVNEDFVVADELANSLHPHWVSACLGELGDRQAFLTSQSPLLFEHVSLGSAADFRTSLILCGVGLHEGREQRSWSNPTGELAEKLSAAIKVGDSSLGALLRAHGLW